DGRWHGWVTMRSLVGGGRERRHVSGKSRTVVAKKVRELEAIRANRKVIDVETVSTWFEHWLTNIAANRVRPRTLEGYQSTVRLPLAPTLGNIPVPGLRTDVLERLYKELETTGLNPSTILRGHRIVASALKSATKRQKIPSDVAKFVQPPRPNGRYHAKPLT